VQLDDLQKHHLLDLIWCMVGMGLVAKLLDPANRSLKWYRVGTCLLLGGYCQIVGILGEVNKRPLH